MKTKFLTIPMLSLLAVFGLFAASPTFGQQDIKTVYDKGVALYNQGKFMEALPLFEAVLRANPRLVHARSYAAKCKTAIARGVGPKNNLQGQLSQLVVPEINFAQAPIGDVLDYFTARAQELSGGKVVPNIIYKGTPEQRQNTVITLSLRNVPMTEALRYVGQLSSTRITYEEHAIVADPNPSSVTPAGTDQAQSSGSEENSLFGTPAKSNLFD